MQIRDNNISWFSISVLFSFSLSLSLRSELHGRKSIWQRKAGSERKKGWDISSLASSWVCYKTKRDEINHERIELGSRANVVRGDKRYCAVDHLCPKLACKHWWFLASLRSWIGRSSRHATIYIPSYLVSRQPFKLLPIHHYPCMAHDHHIIYK